VLDHVDHPRATSTRLSPQRRLSPAGKGSALDGGTGGRRATLRLLFRHQDGPLLRFLCQPPNHIRNCKVEIKYKVWVQVRLGPYRRREPCRMRSIPKGCQAGLLPALESVRHTITGYWERKDRLSTAHRRLMDQQASAGTARMSISIPRPLTLGGIRSLHHHHLEHSRSRRYTRCLSLLPLRPATLRQWTIGHSNRERTDVERTE
jgi:hypothetical protein